MLICSPGVKSITAPLVINLLVEPVLPQFKPVTLKDVPAAFLKETPEKKSPAVQPVELFAEQICALAIFTHDNMQ